MQHEITSNVVLAPESISAYRGDRISQTRIVVTTPEGGRYYVQGFKESPADNSWRAFVGQAAQTLPDAEKVQVATSLLNTLCPDDRTEAIRQSVERYHTPRIKVLDEPARERSR